MEARHGRVAVEISAGVGVLPGHVHEGNGLRPLLFTVMGNLGAAQGAGAVEIDGGLGIVRGLTRTAKRKKAGRLRVSGTRDLLLPAAGKVFAAATRLD